MPQEHEYLFDIKLFASLRVKATSEAKARQLLKTALDCATINCGAWPNGEPIVGEASEDGEADLMEIDGEAC